MASKTIIAVVAVVAVVIIAAGVYFAFFNNGGDDAKGDDYYFYVNFGDDNINTKWYSAKGTSADGALADAMKDTGITLSYSSYGYPNFDGSTWGTFTYSWSVCNSATASASVGYAQYDNYGGLIKSNGWDSFSGYGKDAEKLYQSNAHVYYFAPYDATYAITDPTESEVWATAGGVNPFVKNVTVSDVSKFYFFVNMGDNDARTQWYTAEGKDADEALATALKDSGITLGYSAYGYPNFDGQTGGTFAYLWSFTGATEATESVVYPQFDNYGGLIKSNGWESFAGYDDDSAKKLHQSGCSIFYFASYDSSYAIEDPTECTAWQDAEKNNPFKLQ